MEEGQRDFAGVVMSEDAMRNITTPGWCRLMLVYNDFQRDDCTFLSKRDTRPIASVDHAVRCQKQELTDLGLRARYVGAKQFAKQGGNLRANAGKRTNGSKNGSSMDGRMGLSINCFVLRCKGGAQSFCALLFLLDKRVPVCGADAIYQQQFE